MNREIIKNLKLNIYNTDSPNNPQKYTKDILYYIYLFNHIHCEKSYLKKIKENMKHKEKDEKKKKKN